MIPKRKVDTVDMDDGEVQIILLDEQAEKIKKRTENKKNIQTENKEKNNENNVKEYHKTYDDEITRLQRIRNALKIK
ncbi:hypothetical protein AKJ49_00110 [candidate division MSBL1 archaeon SCGC-AAA382A03]|uniref:Uncharacterized protein n=1 Tax=candidate division MSBL1 archaeon SCGC-AAA382A03 TaxID=1698278 RepID=A0A133VH26_9EURY|nr:hypothetical protein AKJ49_00110 [candidate division MSBL1 archaeon SCGC-AAA382A03]